MKHALKLTRHECRDVLRNPAALILISLPVFMSKIIIAVMDAGGMNFMLLSTWILFAQVMVGIMLTGPGLIEEREGRTFDALLLTPLGRLQILAAKGGTILIFCLLSQLVVYAINRGIDGELLKVLPYMAAGGILFVEVGLLIGLKVSSSKNGSAVSSAVMVVLFLLASVYISLPEWTYPLFALLPSIAIVENIGGVLDGSGAKLTESLILLLWIAGLGLWIGRMKSE